MIRYRKYTDDTATREAMRADYEKKLQEEPQLYHLRDIETELPPKPRLLDYFKIPLHKWEGEVKLLQEEPVSQKPYSDDKEDNQMDEIELVAFPDAPPLQYNSKSIAPDV